MKSKQTHRTDLLAVLMISLFFISAGLSAQETSKKEQEKKWIQVLSGNASVADQDVACRQLQVMGTADSIPALSALLTDPFLSHMARYALEPMPYPEAGHALGEALKKTEALLKVGILNSLAWRREKSAVPAITAQLADKDERVIEAAAGALGRIGTPEAAQTLEIFRKNAPPSLRSVAAEASLAVAANLVKTGNAKQAASIYEQLLSSEHPEFIRQGAFAGSLIAQPSEAANKITRFIEGTDSQFKLMAIASIPAIKDPKAIGQFARMLNQVPAVTQVMMIGALADCDPSLVLSAMSGALKSPDTEVKIAAVKALGKAGNAGCVKDLCQALEQAEGEPLKKEVVGSMSRLRGDRVNEEILTGYKAASLKVRSSLIEVLANRRIMESIDSLFQEAKGQPGRVRESALRALGNMAGADRLPDILSLLIGWQGEEERSDAETASIKIARRNSSEEIRADAVLAAFQKASDITTKRSLLNVLGGIANTQALSVIQGMADEKNAQLKDGYVSAIADWPNSKVIDLLLKEWKETGNLRHKTLTLRGSVRILRLNEIPAATTLNYYRYLLDHARNPEDRKFILSGLAESADVNALALVKPDLDNPSIRAEAELSLLQIARRVSRTSPAEAKAVLDKLRQEAQNPEVKTQAEEAYKRIN